MKNKRGQNEGSIRKLERNGKILWEARYSCGFDAEGKRIQRSLYAKTRKECIEKLDQVRNDFREGAYIPPSKVSLDSWLDTWLTSYVQPSKKPGTYESYKDYLRLHVRSVLGNRNLKDIRPSDLQTLYVNLLDHGRKPARVKSAKQYKELSPGHKRSGPPKKPSSVTTSKPAGLSARSVNYIHTVLHAAFDQAIKEGLLKVNPAHACSPPKVTKPEMLTLTQEQLPLFLAEARNTPHYCAYLMAVSTGLRRGEILGLTWDCIDMTSRAMRIKQQLVRTKQGLELSSLKTKLSYRTIKLPLPLYNELKAHKKEQAADKIVAGAAYSSMGLVFCNPIGNPLDPDAFTRPFKRALARLNLPPLRFHDLRHTYATLALKNGVPVKTVSDILGHYSTGFTMDTYAHVTDDMREDSANIMGAIIDQALTK